MNKNIIFSVQYGEGLFVATFFNQSSIKEGYCVLKVCRDFNDLWLSLQVMFH